MVRQRIRHSVFALALTLSSVWSFPGQTQPVGLPSMGPTAGAELSPAMERTLGDAIMEQGRRDPSYIADPDVNQYLTQMGKRLAQFAPPGTETDINVFSIRDARINAFALPGGYIGIHSGLIVTAENESELASVLAHEIAHVSQRHIARGMTQRSQTSHVMMASIVGALLAALAGSGDLAMGVAAFGQAAAVDQQLGFSRQAEQEADRAGLQMMAQAGYDPRGMVEMFNRLTDASRLNQGMGGGSYASTHPLSVQRMSDIQTRIREGRRIDHADSPQFWFIRAKLRVLQANGGQALRHAESILRQETQGADPVKSAAAWYGLAYAAWQRKDYTQAAEAMAQTSGLGASVPQVEQLAIELALAQSQADLALQRSTAATSKWPDSQALALTRARVLQVVGRDEQAVQYLQSTIQQWPDLPDFHRYLAQSQERLGRPVQARQAMATYYELTGALPTAVAQLQQARNMTNDFYVQSQLDVRIRQLKEQLQRDRELLERFKS